MEVHSKCHKCGKEHITNQPEGETWVLFTCECGNSICHGLVIGPFGKVFLYGIESLRRKRYSSACIQFATAFEVFQKQFVESLLKNAGVDQSLARFLVYDLDLPRAQYSQIAHHMLHKKLKQPDVSLRNSAVHFGYVPKPDRVTSLAEEVLEAIDVWLIAAEQRVGPGYQALMDVWMKGGELSRDYTEFDLAIFDLRTALLLVKDQWSETSKG